MCDNDDERQAYLRSTCYAGKREAGGHLTIKTTNDEIGATMVTHWWVLFPNSEFLVTNLLFILGTVISVMAMTNNRRTMCHAGSRLTDDKRRIWWWRWRTTGHIYELRIHSLLVDSPTVPRHPFQTANTPFLTPQPFSVPSTKCAYA